jgi:hypothetical protein
MSTKKESVVLAFVTLALLNVVATVVTAGLVWWIGGEMPRPLDVIIIAAALVAGGLAFQLFHAIRRRRVRRRS